MNLRQLYYDYDIKLVALKGKTRLSSKDKGYGYFNTDGIIEHPVAWDNLIIDNYGVLCDYISDLDLYYCVIDVDTHDFPLQQLLEEFPTAYTVTKHGYHLHYLSPVPCNLKQLTGKEKEQCPVDIRAKRDDDPSKEGNYIRLSQLIGDTTQILEVDYNEVVKWVYQMYGLEAKQRGEHDNDIQEWSGNYKPFRLSKVSNKEYFIAAYLFYQKDDWSSAYDSAFPWGLQLKGTVTPDEAYNISRALMRISGYPRPKKWVHAFMTGYETAKPYRAHFNNEHLPSHLANLLKRTAIDELSREDLKKLAELCKGYDFQDIETFI